MCWWLPFEFAELLIVDPKESNSVKNLAGDAVDLPLRAAVKAFGLCKPMWVGEQNFIRI